MSARPMATICCSPPDSAPDELPAALAPGWGRSRRRGRASPGAPGAPAGLKAPSARFSSTVMLAEEPAALGHHRHAALDDPVRRRARPGPRPPSRMRPARGRSSPAMRPEERASCRRRWTRRAPRSRPARPDSVDPDERPERRRRPRRDRGPQARGQLRRSRAPVPRYASTTAGSAATAPGGPSAIFSPALSTMIRSREVEERPHDVLDHEQVTPSPRSRRMSAMASAVSAGLRPAMNSSSSRSSGDVASARASSRRFRSMR